jgi:serine/threonine-protein kinase
VDGAALGRATQVPVAGDANDKRIGQLVCNRYHLRRVVADGGMGRVYEALDLHDKKNLALKILHPEVANDEVAVERFKREFAVSKQLPHEYIVEVLDFQPTSDGTYALAMEYLYGEELRATLKRETVIAPARVVRMLSQVAIGLDGAHARKLVHRDLKPDNLFLCQTSDGDNVKILDFGSVKDKGETAKKLTVLGTTIGSPYYMAPEQAQGLDTLDHRADVWALAAIVYECITGQVPFTGNNGPAILLLILTKEPTPPSVAAKGKKFPVPPTVDAVIAHALKKSAALRLGSLGALADGMGRAYGLSGSHAEWAYVRESELQRQIDERMPELLRMQIQVAAPTAADAFFGESGLDDPLAATVAAPPGSMPSQRPPSSPVRTDEMVAAGVPTKGSGMGMVLAIAGGALLVGALIAFFVLAR